MPPEKKEASGLIASSTIGEAIEWTASQLGQASLFFGHGTDNPHDEAAWLVSYVTALPPDFDDSVLTFPVSHEQIARITTLLEKRITTRRPLPYLINEAWFAGLKFYVDERVIIPRSPIAELIAEQFVPWLEPDAVKNILDLCTGSACIAIALAQAFPAAKVLATDVSSGALEVAEINVRDHHVADRLQLLQSDLFEHVEARPFDLIVSNPPYVDAEDMAALPDEFQYEPGLALAAGKDGLDLVIPMLAAAPRYLSGKGVLVVEVGNSAEALQRKFPTVPFTWLEFDYGGEGVFLLDRIQLLEYNSLFKAAVNEIKSGAKL